MGQYLFAYSAAAALAVITIVLLAKPIRWLFKLIINCALGFVLLIAFNLLGGLFGLYIGINIITAITVGLLGTPGLAMLLLLRVFI